jgi:hypothetical protein
MSDKLAKTRCPTCGEFTLKITERLKARKIGEFSLSGQQMKVSAAYHPVLYCTKLDCTFERWGWIDGGHVVFDPREGK